MIILVDQDGVLADIGRGFDEAWVRAHPHETFIPEELRTYFQIEDNYPENLRDKVRGILASPGFFAGLPAISGGAEALRGMLRRKHDVFICTSPFKRNINCAAEKLKWIIRNLGEEFAPRVIITEDKTLVRGDILIDDKPKIKGLLKPVWEHVLFDQPYNKTADGKRRLDWFNWKKVLKI